MLPILRPYQQAGICAGISAAKRGRHRNVICVPTGGGKSAMIAETARLSQGRVLVIVPSLPLLSQMHRSLEHMLEERVDLEQGLFRANSLPFYRSRVVLASRDSLLSNDRYKGDAFSGVTCVIVDECHVGITPRMAQMFQHFEDAGAYLFGYSATPYRGKGKSLGYWDRPCYVYSLREAVDDAWLVRPTVHLHEVKSLDFSFVDHVGDEWDETLLAAVLNVEGLCQEVASLILQTYKHEPSVVYCRDVAQAKLLVEILERYGAQPTIVYGSQEQEERDANMKAFVEGRSNILVNVAVLSYGWDFPALRRVYFASPQRSLSRYEQRVGRAMRTLTGTLESGMSLDERRQAIASSAKPVAHIHDITDASRSIQILNAFDVLDALTRQSKKRRSSAMEAAADGGADLLATSDKLTLEEQIEREEQKEALREKRSRLLVGVTVESSDRNPFDEPEKASKSKRGWRMLWGPHRGELIRDLSTGYLSHVSKKARKETPLISAIRRELNFRDAKNEERSGGSARSSISSY